MERVERMWAVWGIGLESCKERKMRWKRWDYEYHDNFPWPRD